MSNIRTCQWWNTFRTELWQPLWMMAPNTLKDGLTDPDIGYLDRKWLNIRGNRVNVSLW